MHCQHWETMLGFTKFSPTYAGWQKFHQSAMRCNWQKQIQSSSRRTLYVKSNVSCVKFVMLRKTPVSILIHNVASLSDSLFLDAMLRTL